MFLIFIFTFDLFLILFLIYFYSVSNLFFNLSSPLSTLLTFPLKEGKDSVGCYFLNPSLLCGEVPALLAMGCLKFV